MVFSNIKAWNHVSVCVCLLDFRDCRGEELRTGIPEYFVDLELSGFNIMTKIIKQKETFKSIYSFCFVFYEKMELFKMNTTGFFLLSYAWRYRLFKKSLIFLSSSFVAFSGISCKTITSFLWKRSINPYQKYSSFYSIILSL